MHIEEDAVRLFSIEMLSYLEVNTDEWIVHFITEERTKFLHALFFNDPTTTDCMSFPIDGMEPKKEGLPHTFGECFVNPEEAKDYDQENPYTELSRYIIHCMLHCKGYEDDTQEKKQGMRALEDSAIKHARAKKVLLTNPNPLYT